MESREVLARLRVHFSTLYRAGLARRLLEQAGSACEVLSLSQETLESIDGVTPTVAQRLLSRTVERQAAKELDRVESSDVDLWIGEDEGTEFEFPESLRDFPDMPLLLFARGKSVPEDRGAVGVVGSRQPSRYGERQARRFAAALAGWKVTITSGLARGIDGIAQREALQLGGRTIAVLGSGLGRIYPPEHRDVVDRIVGEELGAVVSEFPFNTPPRSFHFPQRNRLLSGLSRVLLVVEAGERSGSLITADWALTQDRSVCVIPGRVDEPRARGALRLIREGAIPVLDPEDVLMAKDVTCQSDPAALGMAPLSGPFEQQLEEVFAEEDSWHADDLAERLGVDSSELLAELARLEIEKVLLRDLSGAFSRRLRR